MTHARNNPLQGSLPVGYLAHVFWLRRPPYARWAGMALLVALALFIDLRGRGTAARPFAAVDIAAGAPIGAEQVEWRNVPGDLLPFTDFEGSVAAHHIERGDPLTPSALAQHSPPPDGWWTIELPLPESATVGRRARVVAADPPLATDAVVVSVAGGGAFDASTSGLVAVPREYADAVARATVRSEVTVLLSP